MFQRREQKLQEEVTYYVRLPAQFEDEEAMYEENTPTDTEEQGPDQGYSEDSSDVFIGTATGGDFVRL